ncbi:T-cell-specific surface glycoprotein CD28 [Polymixia lowei]
MTICWIFMVLLSLCHASRSQSTCSNDKLRTECVPVNDSVSVPCPDLTAEEVSFYLLMGQKVIANRTCDYAKNVETIVNITKELAMHMNTDSRSVSFVISGVTAESSGFYSCKAERMYPPPFLAIHNASTVLVLVEGHQCKCSAADCGGLVIDRTPVWIWILGFAGVITYSLTVSIFAVVAWLRLKKAESSQSDYMNTKPRAPKGHRKKKGVQNPVRRHF